MLTLSGAVDIVNKAVSNNPDRVIEMSFSTNTAMCFEYSYFENMRHVATLADFEPNLPISLLQSKLASGKGKGHSPVLYYDTSGFWMLDGIVTTEKSIILHFDPILIPDFNYSLLG